jgi:hypothetical protein
MRIIFSPRRHERGLVNTCWGANNILDGMERVFFNTGSDAFMSSRWNGRCWVIRIWNAFSLRYHGMGLVYTCWHIVISLAWEGFCSTQVEMYFLSLFSQLTMRYILSLRWHGWVCLRYFFCASCNGKGFFNVTWDAFFVLSCMRLLWSTVEICLRLRGNSIVNI